MGIPNILNCTEKNQKTEKRLTLNFNQNWKFKKQDSPVAAKHYADASDDGKWEDVALPHTANIEPVVITGQQWQGTCWYKKTFEIDVKNKGKHIALYFEGAMQVAEVWLNGEKIAYHEGGYLPFYVNLTDKVHFDKANVIGVKLNNEDNPLVPPGKPLMELDFNFYGGLYRNVSLIIKDKIHITDPIQADLVAGGGVFVKTLKANEKKAVLEIRTGIQNESDLTEMLQVRILIYDGSGKLVVSNIRGPKQIRSSEMASFITQVELEKPTLWSPESPKLYIANVELLKEGETIDTGGTNFGIRTIKFDKSGFYLNGTSYKIRGTNRHQEYPYIGYALSDNAQYRDAYKIKQAGFNFVRLSHYPQSEAFMNACDELGILVMDAIPGWQFFGDKIFQENCYKDIRQMVRRDRNHPSVILWEASLNESDMTEEFMDKAHSIVHQELPGNEVYTCGFLDYAYDVFIPARQHAEDHHHYWETKAADYWKKYKGNRPLFISEYGDWEYYSQNAGFSQTAYGNLKETERTSRQLRGDGQIRLSQQALNFQESHNDNLYNSAAGDANWLMFDYNRGYAPDLESSGIMDIFRIPKFSYYFYGSQKDLDIKDPVLFIANYWNDPKFNNVKIYSNCDEVELWLNGKLIERRRPNTDLNSTNLAHPPYTFKNIPYKKGTLLAKGYADGKLITETSRQTPGVPSKIKLSVDECNIPLQAGCNDIVFVYATLTDTEGNYVPIASNTIHFRVDGDAELIGENPAIAEAGIATILLKAGKVAGELRISAYSEEIESVDLKIRVTNHSNRSFMQTL